MDPPAPAHGKQTIGSDFHILTRPKFSETKFNMTCLIEYMETYRTICMHADCCEFPGDFPIADLCEHVR